MIAAVPSPPPGPAEDRGDLVRLGLDLEDDQISMLSRYLEGLLETNRQFNLTGVRDHDVAWRRHIIDSLTLLPFIEDVAPSAKLIDVGSGGGVPGIPVAIARPDLRITLLEGTGKKARFCQRCVADLPLDNVTVINDRAENAGRDGRYRQRYDVAVCRAIGPMRMLLEYTLPLVRIGGRVLAMKGPKAESELQEASTAMDVLGAGELRVFDAYPADFDQNTVIVIITKLAATPKQYPRPPGVPRRSPL